MDEVFSAAWAAADAVYDAGGSPTRPEHGPLVAYPGEHGQLGVLITSMPAWGHRQLVVTRLKREGWEAYHGGPVGEHGVWVGRRG